MTCLARETPQLTYRHQKKQPVLGKVTNTQNIYKVPLKGRLGKLLNRLSIYRITKPPPDPACVSFEAPVAALSSLCQIGDVTGGVSEHG